MVATTQVEIPKNTEKIPRSTVGTKVRVTVSPTSTTDEVQILRLRNKVLTQSLEEIKKTAAKEMQKAYDLVWFANYRYRYPNHEASKRIDTEHREEIEKLRGDDGDYHHGFNSGILAAVRMFKETADILHINDFEELSPDIVAESAKHTAKMETAKKQFPHVTVDPKHDFPQTV